MADQASNDAIVIRVPGPPRDPRSTGQRILVAAVTVASGVGAAWSGAAPTGHRTLDLLLAAALGMLAALAGSRAGFGALALAAGLSLAAFDHPGGASAAAILAVVAAAVFGLRAREWPPVGAVGAAAAVQALLRSPVEKPFGLSAVVAALAMAALAVSAYRRSGRTVRRAVLAAGLLAAGYVVVALAGLGIAVVGSRNDGIAAVDGLRGALDAARGGDRSAASASVAASEASLARIRSRLDGWLTLPARGVPVLAQHVEAGRKLVSTSVDVAASVGGALDRTDLEALRVKDARIDLAQVRSLAAPTAQIAAALDRAVATVGELDSPWLVTPFADAIAKVHTKLDGASSDAATAADAARVLPAMLGDGRPRTYFVAFTTPAEARGLGGFMGNYAELGFADGRLSLSSFGRTAQLLNGGKPASRVITGPADYLKRYARFDPARRWQNVTMSPDFPSVASVMAELYPQSGGRQVDGVIVVDPTALAGLLRLTGPIAVDGLPEPLTADNALSYLLRDQYARNNVDRVDSLGDVAFTVFSRLTGGDLPPVRTIADVVEPLTAGGHLLVWSKVPAEQDLIARVGASGAFTTPEMDGFAVVNHNLNPSKIDAYLERSVVYDATLDADTGRLSATATVTLTNKAPSGGLAPIVIGNENGDPTGTNRSYLSVYSPLALTAMTVDGAPAVAVAESELGWRVYSTPVAIPPGGQVVVRLDLWGSIDLSARRYSWTYRAQPLANQDHLHTTFSVVGAGRIISGDHLQSGGRSADEIRDVDRSFTEVFELAPS
ncbi:MAG: DUF4012 domain-containing protein [Acidimicrobiia bacterium]